MHHALHVDLHKSPKQDTIHAILWVHGDEPRRILQKWMDDRGIKVWLIWQLSELNLIAERLRKLILSQFAASRKSDSSLIGESRSSPSAYTLSREEQDGAKIARNQSCNSSSSSFITRVLRSFSGSKSAPGYILLLLDTTCMPFVEGSWELWQEHWQLMIKLIMTSSLSMISIEKFHVISLFLSNHMRFVSMKFQRFWVSFDESNDGL